MKFKTAMGYVGNLPVTEGFVRDVMGTLTHNELRAYLVILMLCVNKRECEASELAEKLSVSVDDVLDIVAALEKKKIIKFKSNTVTFLCEEKDCTVYDELFEPEDLKEMPRQIFDEFHKCFGKLLSNSDINTLVAAYKKLKLPDEVIIVILQYCASKEYKKISYFEKIAGDWSEHGIDTAQAAHEYIALIEKRATLYEKVKRKLGIYGRELTAEQKRYVDKWEGKFSLDEIQEAYEAALDYGAKKPFVYANKVLNSEPAEKTGQKPKKTVQVKKSRFNNFEQKKPDYEAIEKRNLEKLLKELEE
jgi:DnaD/phage-associated family protein